MIPVEQQPDAQPVHWVAYRESPLAYLASLVIRQQAEQLPDLSSAHFILADTSAAAELRHHLVLAARQAGFHALLGVRITSLNELASRYRPTGIQVCDAHSQELMLVEALTQYPSLLGSASPWVMAENLLSLFAELTLKHVQLADSQQAFVEQLQQAYGRSDNHYEALGKEAHLIHTLWQAWHQQLQADNLLDTHSAYLHGLAHSLDMIDSHEHVYMAGFHQFNPAEISWIESLISRQQISLILHGNAQDTGKAYHPDTPLRVICEQLGQPHASQPQTSAYTRFINEVFNTAKSPLRQRAHRFSTEVSESPLQDRIQVFTAQHAEQEAHAIDLQVRYWLSQSDQYQSIAIVTENRRLARRVRALLERSQVPLQDASGWALSTTSAAALVERWLECIEEDFDYLALLDLLKSPFIFFHEQDEQLQQAVHRFELDVIRHENVSRNIQAYQAALQARRERLTQYSPGLYDLLYRLLEKLETSARKLKALQQSRQKIKASQYLEHFLASLDALGINDAFKQDLAGLRLLQAFNDLQHASKVINLPMNWQEFRTWLGRQLERMNFQPVQVPSVVQLMGLSQSRLQQFDALIIAGAEMEYLPGHTRITPFFNDAARSELRLATTTTQLSERLHHFRRLLESAPEILITLRGEEHGEPVNVSPWLEAIQAFHRHAYGYKLEATTLSDLLQEYPPVVEDKLGWLPPPSTQPRPVLASEEVPQSISPSAYQKLLDCPYRFFASYILNLKASEEVSEALARDEYGRRIHLCLQAFHSKHHDLPGPFTHPLDDKHRDQAIKLLSDIANAVFQPEEEKNFEHLGWLQQWLSVIPFYIDWEIKRRQQWQVLAVEQAVSAQLDEQLAIKGRLDRIDINSTQQLSIIDYKTGQIPAKAEVLSGEYVQLPFYSLLEASSHQRDVAEVAYLQLGKAETLRIKTSIQGDELHDLQEDIARRLKDIVMALKNSQPLPAWSDKKTCSYCDMEKLCRREAWQDSLNQD